MHHQQFLSIHFNLIATDTGQQIVHGFNPDYIVSQSMHLLYHFFSSIRIPNTSTQQYKTILGLCNNKSYVNKLNEIITDPKYLKYLYKTTENEAYKLVSTIIPSNYDLHHVKIHQDDSCVYEELKLPAKLNIQADKTATQHARKPINNHFIASPFAIYIENNYISHNMDRNI